MEVEPYLAVPSYNPQLEILLVRRNRRNDSGMKITGGIRVGDRATDEPALSLGPFAIENRLLDDLDAADRTASKDMNFVKARPLLIHSY